MNNPNPDRLLRLAGGTIYDPTTESCGQVRDLWIRGDRIIEPPRNEPPHRELDLTGTAVMAGGIDLHTHIGGGKLAIARTLLPEYVEQQKPTFLPSSLETGIRYLRMGYTACFEPAMIPWNARAAHAEMADTPGIDTGGYCLLGNEDALLKLLQEDAPQALVNAYVASMVVATQAIAVKVVNAGGVHAFRFHGKMLDVDQPHPKFGVTPAIVIRRLARAVKEIGLRHPLHVHCSNLGVPGNIESTLKTIQAADGYPIHLTHVQFHTYSKDGPRNFGSASAMLIDALHQNPSVTSDVGQIMFGQTVTLSADVAHQSRNTRFARPRKSVLLDIECQAGCGVLPFRYRNRHFVHALQWAIGLELFLMMDDPSRVFLTTDHPNGAPFTTYPHLIRLLMDAGFRHRALDEIDPEAAALTSLRGMDREYSLHDIAVMTRSAPADVLGL